MSPTPGGAWPLITNANTPKQWRHNRFVQFGVRERKDRNWISFREIAEWVAELACGMTLNGRGGPRLCESDYA